MDVISGKDIPSKNARELAIFRRSCALGTEFGFCFLIKEVRQHLNPDIDRSFPDEWCLNRDPDVKPAVRSKYICLAATGQRESSSPWMGEILHGLRLERGSSFLARKSGPGLKTKKPVGATYVNSDPLRRVDTSLIRPPEAKEIKKTVLSRRSLRGHFL